MTTLKGFSLPPDTRTVGSGNPPADIDAVVDALNDWGYPYHICNTAWAGGAPVDGTSDCTAAIQACMNAAAAAGFPVFIPGGVQFRVSQLTWNAGQVLQGVYSGSYPLSDAITTASLLVRLPSTNLDLIVAADGTNYGRISDIAIDGNKANNTSGIGVNIQDGASTQACQIIVERCYFHDNPGSNLYLGHNRDACRVMFGVFNYSANGDGITVCGSDNLIMSNICGTNSARAGINLGSTTSQNWASFGSNLVGSTNHVLNNDCYGDLVGICLPSAATRNVIIGNGLDRNTNQGLTVYSGDCNTITGNAFHSNGQGADNTYGHIDLATGVTGVVIDNNTFGPIDGGITNFCSYCVAAASGIAAGTITGNIGTYDASDTHGGLINLPAKLLTPAPAINPAAQLYGYLGWTYDQAMASGGAALGAAGTITLCKIPWPVTQSVTNIVARVTAGGGTLTAAQCFAGIYDSSGNRLGVTADQSGTWNSSAALKTMAISGGPITVPGGGLSGFIYVALLWNGTTSPSFLKAASIDAVSFNGALGAAALRGALNSSANTSLPTPLTLSSSTAGTQLFWAALS